MSTNQLVIISFLFVVFFITCSSFGLLIFNLFSKIFKIKKGANEKLPLEIIGASTMIGIGTIGYLAMILGIIGLFTKINLYILLASALLVSLPQTLKIIKSILPIFRSIIPPQNRSVLALTAIVAAVLITGSLYLSSMQPPYASDELHFHFPQARQIVENAKISIDFGGHYFYGNIPKLMEVLFALGISLYGYAFAHLINFLILISFLMIVFGIISKNFDSKAACFSVFLLLIFDDFTWNATTGFIDSATLAGEIGSLLLVFDYLKNKSTHNLVLAGSLLGISLSMKYSPLFSALFISFYLLFIFIKSKPSEKRGFLIKVIFPFLIPCTIFAAYWYIKNLTLFSNPFYPLYFGHRGVPELQYTSLIGAIQQFGPKTIDNFFKLISVYKKSDSLLVYLSIFIPIVGLAMKKRGCIYTSLFIFYISFIFYWFFLATHQIRFLAPSLVVASILTAIVASRIKDKYLVIIYLICVSIFFGRFTNPLGTAKSYWTGFWNTKLHLIERQFALGNENQSHFLKRQFGCQYSVIEYLETNNLKGKVIDNWSVWHAPSVSFYSQNNIFMTFGFDLKNGIKALHKSLIDSDIKYLYFNTEVKKRHLSNADPEVVENKNMKLPVDTYLLNNAKLIFREDKCELYLLKI